jgi:hypothetical protein
MRVFLVLVLTVGCGAAPPPAPPGPHITDLDWLVGTWTTDDGTMERWSRDGDALVGEGSASRPCADTAPPDCVPERVVTETIRIEEREDGPFYVATPVDQERTEFAIGETSRAGFVAENPAHDFPTRIEYRLVAGTIHALVSGPERSFELELRPVGH